MPPLVLETPLERPLAILEKLTEDRRVAILRFVGSTIELEDSTGYRLGDCDLSHLCEGDRLTLLAEFAKALPGMIESGRYITVAYAPPHTLPPRSQASSA